MLLQLLDTFANRLSALKNQLRNTKFADEAKVRGLKVHWRLELRMIMTNENSILKATEANSM